MEDRVISDYNDLIKHFAHGFGISRSPDTLTHHPDAIQTHSDTIQTTLDIGNFTQTGQKTISAYQVLIYFLPTNFSVSTSKDIFIV